MKETNEGVMPPWVSLVILFLTVCVIIVLALLLESVTNCPLSYHQEWKCLEEFKYKKYMIPETMTCFVDCKENPYMKVINSTEICIRYCKEKNIETVCLRGQYECVRDD